jgi:putative membrane protein
MKQFNQDFKTNLYKTIEEIEGNSQVEIVVIAKAKSEDYREYSLLFGAGFMIAAYLFIILVPFIEFAVDRIPIYMLLCFVAGYFIHYFFNPLKVLTIPKTRMKKTVEIMARAIFQKGGIHHTRSKIGVLIYASFLEKIVYVIPDKGAEIAVPESEWLKINDGFNEVFKSPEYAKALLDQLKACKPIFNQYIPPVENDINELADDMTVDL